MFTRVDQAVALTKEYYSKAIASEHGQKVHQALLDGKHKACDLWKQIQPQLQASLQVAQVCGNQSNQSCSCRKAVLRTVVNWTGGLGTNRYAQAMAQESGAAEVMSQASD